MRSEHVSPQIWHLLEIRRLKLAGYPFGPDDLDYISWQLLAVLEEKIDLEKRKGGIENGGLS